MYKTHAKICNFCTKIVIIGLFVTNLKLFRRKTGGRARNLGGEEGKYGGCALPYGRHFHTGYGRAYGIFIVIQ